MLTHLCSVIERECLILPDRPVLVGVSGGPDSLCLLHALRTLGYPLLVAHLDHGLRPESGREAQIVAEFTRQLSVDFFCEKVDVAGYANDQGLSVEEAARMWRYRFLFRVAETQGAQAVAVGHTADDQVETVMMHLLRGSGLAGLRGMAYRSLPNAWSSQTPLVRPLLGVWREEIMEYLEQHRLHPNLDASNQDIRFYRNRLRHELIPYLEGYNCHLRPLLWQMAEIIRQDYAVLENVVDESWRTCLVAEATGAVALAAQALRDLPRGLQRGVVRRAISRLRPGLRDVDFAAVEQALDFLHSPSRSAQRDLAAGVRLLLEPDRLWLATWEADLPAGGWPQLPGSGEILSEANPRSFRLEAPGELDLPGGWLLRAEVIHDAAPARQQAYHNPDPYQAWLDADTIHLPLTVRARCPGDRFQPLGLGGHTVKLSDFMVNVGLTRRARQRWPVVLSGDQIVWIPGFRLAHPVRLSERTTRILYLRLTREAPDTIQ